jgi:glycosyltransferase involved in cell wall biosynthesis
VQSKHILFISKSASDASTRYRGLQYSPFLQKNGYTTEHVKVSGGIKAFLNTLVLAYKADIVIVIRRTFPYFLTWLLRRVSQKLIFDMDDAIFCSSDGSASQTRMKRFIHMARVSDHIFAGNQFLAKKALEFNDAVSVVPTSLKVQKYDVATEQSNEYVDLVWIGSRSTSKYLLDILPELEALAKKFANLRLKIIADFNLPDAKLPVIAVPWSEDNEVKELLSSDIGIAPMRSNDWTRGKCALKVLQYMAARLPVVSSNVGVNGDAVTEGETGLLVNSPQQWQHALSHLIEEQAYRVQLGEAGFEKVSKNYDINVVFKRVLTQV